MDPVEMVNLIRRDFKSNRWVVVLFVAIVVVGTAFWQPVLAARGSIPRSVSPKPVVSVLPDPFVRQKQ